MNLYGLCDSYQAKLAISKSSSVPELKGVVLAGCLIRNTSPGDNSYAGRINILSFWDFLILNPAIKQRHSAFRTSCRRFLIRVNKSGVISVDEPGVPSSFSRPVLAQTTGLNGFTKEGPNQAGYCIFKIYCFILSYSRLSFEQHTFKLKAESQELKKSSVLPENFLSRPWRWA
jgi:hypothetical protein